MTSPSFPVSLDALANPGPTTETDDTGFELDIVVSRLQNIAMALEQKVGVGASTPPGTAAVLRRTAAGASAWGQVAGGDVAGGGVANRVLATADGSTVAMQQIASAMLGAGAAGLISATTFGPLSTTSTAIVGMTGSDLNGVVTTGKRVLIGATLVGLGVGGAATAGSAVQVFKDGVVFQQIINQATPSGLYTTVTATGTDVPTAGTHSWFLAWMTTAGCTFSCNAGILWIAEIRGG
jgi:hypothetical protein